MTVTSTLSTGDEPTTSSFNNLDHAVRHSLYRNGAVLTSRDADGSDQRQLLSPRECRLLLYRT